MSTAAVVPGDGLALYLARGARPVGCLTGDEFHAGDGPFNNGREADIVHKPGGAQ